MLLIPAIDIKDGKLAWTHPTGNLQLVLSTIQGVNCVRCRPPCVCTLATGAPVLDVDVRRVTPFFLFVVSNYRFVVTLRTTFTISCV